MVHKFMYYGLCPEHTGAENEAILVQMVVSRVNALDRIDNDLNITHRRVVLRYAHIQTVFKAPQKILCKRFSTKARVSHVSCA